jgi:preprotein translocase subunit YajC
MQTLEETQIKIVIFLVIAAIFVFVLTRKKK